MYQLFKYIIGIYVHTIYIDLHNSQMFVLKNSAKDIMSICHRHNKF